MVCRPGQIAFRTSSRTAHRSLLWRMSRISGKHQNYLEGWAPYEDEVAANRHWPSLLRGFYSRHRLLGRLGRVSIIDIRSYPASSRLRKILTGSPDTTLGVPIDHPVDTRPAPARTYFRTAVDSSAVDPYVTAPSTIPTSNNTRTYTTTNQSRIRMERIAASAYDDRRRMAIKERHSCPCCWRPLRHLPLGPRALRGMIVDVKGRKGGQLPPVKGGFQARFLGDLTARRRDRASGLGGCQRGDESQERL